MSTKNLIFLSNLGPLIDKIVCMWVIRYYFLDYSHYIFGCDRLSQFGSVLEVYAYPICFGIGKFIADWKYKIPKLLT